MASHVLDIDAGRNEREGVHRRAARARIGERDAARPPRPDVAAAPRQAADFSAIPMRCKLEVGACDDPLEAGADRIAERVMEAADVPAQHTAAPGWPPPLAAPRLRRCACGALAGPSGQCARCKQAAGGSPARSEQASGAAPTAVQDVLRGAGRPLDAESRGFFEPRFGRDFSGVRVHADAAAAVSAKAVGARAYTVGDHVVFGPGEYAPASRAGRTLLAHELAHVVQQGGLHAPRVQRKCGAELGPPKPPCESSSAGVVGWQFMFKPGCDELLPGEADTVNKLKAGYSLKIHGFASNDEMRGVDVDLSCHRANRIADLARLERADCPVIGTFAHGASPPAPAAGKAPDANPPAFWSSVNVEQVAPTPQPGQQWLDPAQLVAEGEALAKRAKGNPTQANLDAAAAHRAKLKTWLETVPANAATGGATSANAPVAKLHARDLSNYTRFLASAEDAWQEIDRLLAVHKHPRAATDTYTTWAVAPGKPQGTDHHARNVPTNAVLHVDLFGEGHYKGAINIGDTLRTTTTGISGSRVPNLIYRHLSTKDATLPIADHTADLVTCENGPINMADILDEIVRITTPGGTIILMNPVAMKAYHDKLVTMVKGKATQVTIDGKVEMLQTTVVVAGP